MRHCINLANPRVLAKGGAGHATLPLYPAAVMNDTSQDLDLGLSEPVTT